MAGKAKQNCSMVYEGYRDRDGRRMHAVVFVDRGENGIQFKLIFVPATSEMINLNRGIKYKIASATRSSMALSINHSLFYVDIYPARRNDLFKLERILYEKFSLPRKE